MSVYIDHARLQFRGMMMSHMIADSSAELLAMVDAIGVARKWIQYPGTYREHFDVCESKRFLAIRHGAIEVTTLELAKIRRAKQVPTSHQEKRRMPGA